MFFGFGFQLFSVFFFRSICQMNPIKTRNLEKRFESKIFMLSNSNCRLWVLCSNEGRMTVPVFSEPTTIFVRLYNYVNLLSGMLGWLPMLKRDLLLFFAFQHQPICTLHVHFSCYSWCSWQLVIIWKFDHVKISVTTNVLYTCIFSGCIFKSCSRKN